ncbi:putative Ig domain-containing protein [Larkinella sp. VNQ87]|uniref:putative Ig domain-containing protein n=1 Tax=Larkinella sp. VNQ87 TaxID=3400921 RepID=UPI003C0CB701
MKRFLPMYRLNRCLLLAGLLLASLTVYSQKIYYVTPTGGGSQDGSSWENAFKETQLRIALETALEYSQTNGNQEVQVWVAAGVYKPAYGAADRTLSFSLLNNVALYGGFSGTETLLSDRPPINLSTPSSTTLSGDIGGPGNDDNSYHIIDNASMQVDNSAILDGFVITGGNANDISDETDRTGGAIVLQNSSPTIRNCFFTGNAATSGGAIRSLANSGGVCSPVLTNCVFTGNSASSGGALYNYVDFSGQCKPVITNCLFSQNTSTNGGAMFNGITGGGTCSPVITRSSFTNNSSSGNSGVIANDGGSPVVTNCSFVGNSAFRGGISVNYSVQLFTNCTFVGNTATDGAGLSHQTGGSTTFKNCIIWNNDGNDTFFNSNGSKIYAYYSLFDTQATGYEGANNLTTPTSPFVSDSDLQLKTCTPAIDAGDPASTDQTSGTTDLAGNPRFFNSGRIDIGAFELHTVSNCAPVSGSFDGYIYGADCGSFRGWAWDRNKPNAVVSVDIFDNGNLIATLPAGDFRLDLLNAGKGNGKHAFQFVLPESLKDGLPHTLSAKVTGSNFTLKDSPKALICQNSTVPPGNKPPVPPTPTVLIAPVAAKEGVPFSGTLVAFTDPEGGLLTYTLSGLPAGLSLHAASRVISGTPTGTGTFVLTYSAKDEPGATNSVSFNLTVSPAGSDPVSGNFDGYLDKLDCGGIRGWVWDRDKPNTPLTVEFYTEISPGNETIWGSALANIYRQDLKDANKGNGVHAYNFTPPIGLTSGTVVKARVLGSTFVLKGSPKTYQCGSARLSAEGANDLQLTVFGNPVTGDAVEFEVRGASGQALRLQLSDASGRPISERFLERAETVERQTLPIGQQSAGLLLLRATSGLQSVTVKLLKP